MEENFNLNNLNDRIYIREFKKFLEDDLDCDFSSYLFTLTHSNHYLVELIDNKIKQTIDQITKETELELGMKKLSNLLRNRCIAMKNLRSLDFNMSKVVKKIDLDAWFKNRIPKLKLKSRIIIKIDEPIFI